MKSLRLVARDVAVLQVTAEARCLSAEQLQRLFFAGRSDRAMRKRLFRLLSGERPYLKRITWFDRTGQRSAYSVAPAGYAELEGLGEREPEAPSDDIGVEYLKHHLLLTELYVGLVAAPMEAAIARRPAAAQHKERRTAHARAGHPGFRWHVVGDVELPWKQVAGSKLESRIIRPDAVLELLAARRRVFVEAETGSHSLTTSNAKKLGATTNKMNRYEAFCATPSGPGTGRSWYTERYRDGFAPEVLFLVPTETRRQSVARAIEDWRRAQPRSVCAFRVATVAEEVARLVPLVWPGVTAVPAVSSKPASEGRGPEAVRVELSRRELLLVDAFVRATRSDYKTRRDRYRAAGKAPPEYPAGTEEVSALLERLRQKMAG